MTVYNLVSFAGIFVLIAVAWALSADRRNLNWRVIGWGIGLQLLVAIFIFVVPAGTRVFVVVNDAVTTVLSAATAGTKFVFGRLALPPGATNEAGETSSAIFWLSRACRRSFLAALWAPSTTCGSCRSSSGCSPGSSPGR